jgi:hypothetical protein
MGFTFALFRLVLVLGCTCISSRAQFIRQQLAYGSITSLNATSSSKAAHVFDIPASGQLSVSIALCGTSLQSNTSFLLINDTRQDVQTILNNGGGGSTWTIDFSDGYGTWTGSAEGGAMLAFEALNTSIEIGISDGGTRTRRV